MRFTEAGPSIPNELLDARDAGSVVFLCGAGLSIPAGLPNFAALTAQVGSRLNVPPTSDLGRMIEIGCREQTSSLSESFYQNISFDSIFSRMAKHYRVEQIEEEVRSALITKRSATLKNHKALLDLSRGPDQRQRLITTNFDRLFQKAQPKLRSYIPPHFPVISGSAGFDGVVHLHGLIPSAKDFHSQERMGLVLTSGDFGRAYLAEGWATRFICSLLDQYVVVLLGHRLIMPQPDAD